MIYLQYLLRGNPFVTTGREPVDGEIDSGYLKMKGVVAEELIVDPNVRSPNDPVILVNKLRIVWNIKCVF